MGWFCISRILKKEQNQITLLQFDELCSSMENASKLEIIELYFSLLFVSYHCKKQVVFNSVKCIYYSRVENSR